MFNYRSQWSRGLWRSSMTARLLKLWVRTPPGAWMSVCYECCVLSVRDLCDGLIARPEEFYRLWCVWVWSWILLNEEPLAHWGLSRQKEQTNNPACVIWITLLRHQVNNNNYFFSYFIGDCNVYGGDRVVAAVQIKLMWFTKAVFS
jgi:hypothetical protein